MSDEPLHEIQLNGKQLVFVFMAATVVAVVIFLCGVMVGRGVQGRMLAGTVDAPLDPTAIASRARPVATRLSGEVPASAREVLTYPNRLETAGQMPETLDQPLLSAPAAAPRVMPAASAVDAEPPGTGVSVTVGSYQERTAAEAVARRLAALGYPSYISVDAPGGQPRFWVRVGKYEDRRDAEAVRARLEREEQFRPVITP